jgi:hypothetical protein
MITALACFDFGLYSCAGLGVNTCVYNVVYIPRGSVAESSHLPHHYLASRIYEVLRSHSYMLFKESQIIHFLPTFRLVNDTNTISVTD